MLLSLLLFVSYSQNYTVAPLIVWTTYVLEGLAVLVGAIAIFNLRHSLNVAPQPVSKGKLQVQGIYRYIRHPMYTSVFLLSAGVAISSGSYIKLGILLLVLVFFYIKTGYEESLLLKEYPKYREYQEATGKYLPRPTKCYHQ